MFTRGGDMYLCCLQDACTVEVCFYWLGVLYTLSSDARVFTNQSDINSGSSIVKDHMITRENTGDNCDIHKVFLKVRR